MGCFTLSSGKSNMANAKHDLSEYISLFILSYHMLPTWMPKMYNKTNVYIEIQKCIVIYLHPGVIPY